MDSHKKILTYSIDMAQVNPMSDDKVVVIRQPSTANLMIDSNDRNQTTYPYPADFTIQRNYSILNGFFTRLGVEEVTLDWGLPNINNIAGNTTFTVTVTGAPANPYTVTLPQGMYTIAQVLDTLVALLNAAQATGTFSIVSATGGFPTLVCTVTYIITATTLSNSLGLTAGGAASLSKQIPSTAQLSTYSYIDIISPELTYAQKLKDSTTNTYPKDVLCRWYMAWDNPPQNDKYGFPILMGYQPFTCRRIFSPPKMIRWEPNLPIGNLSFEVWGTIQGAGVNTFYQQLNSTATQQNMAFQLTLQVSEV
jgi:hypothetical protein